MGNIKTLHNVEDFQKFIMENPKAVVGCSDNDMLSRLSSAFQVVVAFAKVDFKEAEDVAKRAGITDSTDFILYHERRLFERSKPDTVYEAVEALVDIPYNSLDVE